MPDKVILVNEYDEVIGEMDKIDAHRGNGRLHRAISVYLFRQKNQTIELLIQQRSAEKIVGAEQWANTCCGNVRPTETYEQCARRRLKEELGIDAQSLQLLPIQKFQYSARCNAEFSENEMDQVFAGWFDGQLQLNLHEVQDTRWFPFLDLPAALSQKSPVEMHNEALGCDFAPWFVIMMQKPDLVSLLQHFAQEKK